jgi:hypothetical protein
VKTVLVDRVIPVMHIGAAFKVLLFENSVLGKYDSPSLLWSRAYSHRLFFLVSAIFFTNRDLEVEMLLHVMALYVQSWSLFIGAVRSISPGCPPAFFFFRALRQVMTKDRLIDKILQMSLYNRVCKKIRTSFLQKLFFHNKIRKKDAD